MIFGCPQKHTADVDLDGNSFRITMPAPDGPRACLWALIDDWYHLMPGALPDSQRAYWEDRLADPDDLLDRHMLRPVAFKLASQVYGVPWWAAHRILEEAAESYLAWQVWCVRNGFDPRRESADRIVASCVAWIAAVHWDDDAKAKAWHQRTFMAPAGVKV